jgi:outer membrane phospholipase A
MAPRFFPAIFSSGVITLISLSCHASSGTDPASCNKIRLRDYEPNIVAFRRDEHDEEHIDFTLSQMVPIFHDGCRGDSSEQSNWYFRPYFSFTGEFGFYALGNRDSRPVIGKRFNPKFFARHWYGSIGSYVDVGYAHESNGQSINTEDAYLQKIAELEAKGERREFADDYLSRGWDYINVIVKHDKENDDYFASSVYLQLKYFLEDSPLQGEPEEFYSWETNEGKKRRTVDGVSVMVKSSTINTFKKTGLKLALTYTTGYEDTFENNTVKLEATYRYKEWPPILLWVSEGYNSNLTDYYKKITTVGVGFELRNFLNDY